MTTILTPWALGVCVMLPLLMRDLRRAEGARQRRRIWVVLVANSLAFDAAMKRAAKAVRQMQDAIRRAEARTEGDG